MMFNKLYLIICTFALLLSSYITLGQSPVNDDCNNSGVINVSNNGYGSGVFRSSITHIGDATMQTNEYVPPSLNSFNLNIKSIWYKFTIATNRSVRVSLKQPIVNIAAGDAGFAVYKADNCLPNSNHLSTKLTPLATFGNSYHPCLDSGTYYVQVLGNFVADGDVFVELDIAFPNAVFDNTTAPASLGILNNGHNSLAFNVSCHSIETPLEVCNNNKFPQSNIYNKSAWITFTTPAYFDAISILLAKNSHTLNDIIGYSIYEGNVQNTPFSNLVAKVLCDTFNLNDRVASVRNFHCNDLDPNKTYSIHLLFEEDFYEEVKLSIFKAGTQPTSGHAPSISTIGNNMFNTINNAIVSRADYFGCNAIFETNSTCPLKPSSGVNINNTQFNLSSFFTFKITEPQNVYLNLNTWNLCSPRAVRVFKSSLYNTCSALSTNSLIYTFTADAIMPCLDTGDYIIQVLSSDNNLAAVNFDDINNTASYCGFGGLGEQFTLTLRATPVHLDSRFSLFTPSQYDAINSNNPLAFSTIYNAAIDTFSCKKTVFPADPLRCGNVDRAIYRQFTVSDSGMIEISNFNNDVFNNRKVNYVLYSGNASTLSIAQNVNTYPNVITGLDRITNCIENYGIPLNACLTPGTYTLVAQADSNMVNWTDAPTFSYAADPISRTSNPLLSRNIGTISNASATLSGMDTFSCHNNAESIAGYAPCNIKAIYREFYLSDPQLLRIRSNSSLVSLRLFEGRASQGLAGLTLVWDCFIERVSERCEKLTPGWYTIVSYGDGVGYDDSRSAIKRMTHAVSEIIIEKIQACTNSPQFNRPYKASYATNNMPHIISWDTAVASNVVFPHTQSIINLPTEYFDCTIDTGAVDSRLFNCNNTNTNRIAFYVLEVKRNSYLRIEGLSKSASLYSGNIRTDSFNMVNTAPIQTCVSGNSKIEICNLQPGFYTLIIYAQDGDVCTSVSPSVIVDQVGESRFDFAQNAYDFGNINNNGVYIHGKTGDIHPTHPGRAPSNDFFYCTTGSVLTDPADAACNVAYNENIYPASVNNVMYTNNTPYNAIRRNLWYTFQTSKTGLVSVRIDSKNPYQNTSLFNVAIYKSDVDPLMPFNTIQGNNLVDSTILQGLTLVKTSVVDPNVCTSTLDVQFNIGACDTTHVRYYVLVDIPADLLVNQQIEVGVKQDTLLATGTLFDHYSTAGNIGILYADTLYTGPMDNFTCATKASVYPSTMPICANKTIWYQFEVGNNVSGNIYIKSLLDSISNNGFNSDTANFYLYREILNGDSTANGLQRIPIYNSIINNEVWNEACVNTGKYYLIYSGCNRNNEYIQPQIRIVQSQGDFCSNAVPIILSNQGVGSSTVLINCHTIGNDYGEYNVTLSCPINGVTTNYKSTWFKIDIAGSDTVDVSTTLISNTNVQAGTILYRMMTGDCNAMQEQSCVTDALTQNTYECMIPGKSYYFQVLSPVEAMGSITFSINAANRLGDCSPMINCLKNANFSYHFDCTQNDSVSFFNNSTYGNNIAYLWDFDYNGQTSTAVNPKFKYPGSMFATTYNVSLRVVNTQCIDTGYYSIPVVVSARPEVLLGNDTTICGASAYTLYGGGFPGVSYLWNDNSTAPNLTIDTSGIYSVQLSYNGCTDFDTISINLSSLQKTPNKSYILCNDTSQITLDAGRALNQVTYLWSNNATTNAININNPGIYWVDVMHNNCIVRDSFIVTRFNDTISLLPNDTLICNLQGALTLDASTQGAISYLWNTTQTTPSISVTQSGLFYVAVSVGNCTLRDSINVVIARDTIINYYDTLCANDTFRSIPNRLITMSGIYVDSFLTRAGCDSLIIYNVHFRQPNTTTLNQSICANQVPYLWNNQSINTTGTYTHHTIDVYGCDSLVTLHLTINNNFYDSTNIVLCSNELPYYFNNRVIVNTGIYKDTLLSVAGCDSILVLNLLVNHISIDTVIDTICYNMTYTLPNNTSVNQSGIYVDSFQTMNNCDSVIVTRLFVLPNNSATINQQICANQVPYVWNNQTITQSGTYTHTALDRNGCDSMTTLVLTINSFYSTIVNDTICSNELPYVFNARSITLAGTYIDSFVTATGCDSIWTLNLAINNTNVDTIFDTICYNSTYVLPSTIVVNTTGVYIDSFANIYGCDSILITYLQVNPNNSTADSITVCSNQIPYVWNSLSLVSSGTYTYVSNDRNGCDSTATLFFNINDINTIVIFDTTCDNNLPYIFNNRNIVSAGVYTDSFTNAYGCDSIITLYLMVHQSYANVVYDTICYNETYVLPSLIMVNASGIYQSNLTSINNCDSIITTHLFVKPNRSLTIYDTICSNQGPYIWHNQSIITSGNYTHTEVDINGCDSITTLSLHINPNITTVLNVPICSNELPYVFNGNNLYLSGIYNDTLVDRFGCDSFINLNLSVLHSSIDTIFVEKCFGENYLFVDSIVRQTGIYTKILTNVAGCDSVLVLNIRFADLVPKPLVNAFVGYCEGVTAVPLFAQGINIRWYTSLTGGAGTIVPPTPNTNVTGNTKYYVTQTINGCESERAEIDVYVSKKPVVGIDAIQKACEIDSVLVKINVPSNPVMRYFWNFDGGSSRHLGNQEYMVIWSRSGSKRMWLVAEENGCYSDTTFFNIQIGKTPETPDFNLTPIVCQGDVIVTSVTTPRADNYEWYVNNDFYSNEDSIRIRTNDKAGDYKIKLQVYTNGCYSLPVEKTVFVSTLPDASILSDESIVCINDTFYAEAKEKNSAYSYLWESNNPFLFDSKYTDKMIGIMENEIHTYLTVTNEYGCAVTDSLFLPTQHCCDLWVPNAFSPNGDGLNDDYRIYAKTNQKIKDFSIYDRYGKRVFYTVNQNVVWDGLVDGKNADLNVYYYIIQYSCSDGKEYTLKGDITLIK